MMGPIFAEGNCGKKTEKVREAKPLLLFFIYCTFFVFGSAWQF